MILFFSFLAQARDWERINVPGAVCGDGLPYSVFLSPGDPQKLLIEFQGGGACWSMQTCYGLSMRAWMHPVPILPAFSVPTATDIFDHPWKKHTAIFFPYCTGDVFAADHTAKYGPTTVHHAGYADVLKAIDYVDTHSYKMSQAKEILLFGTSAGGIGAMLHVKNVESHLKKDCKKVLIVDSVGLHFGAGFWEKFSPELFKDMQNNFSKVGMKYTAKDGFLAAHLGPVFENLKDWNIGILQNSKDVVMSLLFGEISLAEHEKLVLGPEGLPAQAAKFKNVKTFVAHGFGHTFLQFPFTALTENETHKTALQFTIDVYNSGVR